VYVYTATGSHVDWVYAVPSPLMIPDTRSLTRCWVSDAVLGACGQLRTEVGSVPVFLSQKFCACSARACNKDIY